MCVCYAISHGVEEAVCVMLLLMVLRELCVLCYYSWC